MAEVLMKRFGRKAHEFIMRDPKHDKKHTLLVGSVRSSKTFTAHIAKSIVQLTQYELPINAKRIMSGSTKQTFYRNVLLDLQSVVGKDNMHYNSSNGELMLYDKLWFVIGAKDEASYKQILGSTVGLWLGDEVVEYPDSFLAQMWMRMSITGSRSYLTTNAGNPHQYLKTDVIDDPGFGKQLEVINFKLADNPNIDAAEKANIVASQKGVFKLRYIDNLWVVAEGSIYRDSYSEVANLFDGIVTIDGKQIPLQPEPIGLRATGGHVDHWFSVDAGVDHPQCHLEYYDDGDVIWVTREQRWDSRKEMRQKTNEEYIDDLIAFGAAKFQIILPPEALSMKNSAIQRGLWITDADNAVKEGIHTVSTLLASRRLRISKTGCPELVKRLPNYAWDKNAAKLGKEAPMKVEDDDCDALRYGVHGKIPQWRISGV
jgi:PBSX family phage terminase large subunit